MSSSDAFTALLVAFAVAVFGFVGALVYLDRSARDEMARGTTVGGVDVGGLTKAEAVRRVSEKYDRTLTEPVKVRANRRWHTLSASKAGVAVDVAGAVDRALDAGRRDNFIVRGWREMSGGRIFHDEPVGATASSAAVRRFVGRIEKAVATEPRDAQLRISVRDVSARPAVVGKKLIRQNQLASDIVAALQDPSADRTLRARIGRVQPKLTTEELYDRTPTIVTVSKSETRVRVFKRGKVVKSYRVAVGSPAYPTPEGMFAVESKQVNPAWIVPNSEWAGELAGEVIPGGAPNNPLIARWIGFNGSVGFHGTPSIGSLGSAASHGCVRMAPADVIDLYERVDMGTRVLVAA